VYSTTAPPGEAAFYGLSYESLGARLWASGPRWTGARPTVTAKPPTTLGASLSS